jgi:ketosteroid isomerase-like protein
LKVIVEARSPDSAILVALARSDAELVRQIWEEWPSAPGSLFDALAERWWDPEITYEEDPKWPGAGTYQGRDAVKAAFAAYVEILGAATLTVEDVIDANDQVVALIRIRGTSEGAEAPWDHVWAYLMRLRERKVVFLRAYWDPQEALADAGVN